MRNYFVFNIINTKLKWSCEVSAQILQVIELMLWHIHTTLEAQYYFKKRVHSPKYTLFQEPCLSGLGLWVTFHK